VGGSAAALLAEARELEHAGSLAAAIASYEAAILAAEQSGEGPVLAEALRRLAVQEHHRDASALAISLCRRSLEVAEEIGDDLAAGEALNTLGVIALNTGALEEARASFIRALEVAGTRGELASRVESNLGIVANIQGDLDEALSRYRHAFEAHHATRNELGCAIALHNLGMVSADRGQLPKAARYFHQSRELAERQGDLRLVAICLVNGAEVDVARQRYESARQAAEDALALFERLGVRGMKAEAYRVIGMVYRETGRPALAEARLQTAIEVAAGAGSVLNEAEACRELAVLHQSTGRNQDALRMLNRAYRLFKSLDARADLVFVGGKVAELEGLYRAIVLAWGRSIESADRFTFGHCERVAKVAVAVARELGLDEHEETAVLLGAYLHDVGLLAVPHEVLTRRGPLGPEDRALLRLHPLRGLDLLDGIEFPWDLKSIIRWHHERYDGTGYPDRLKGSAIPLPAQVVGIAELYDALTTSRGEREALAPAAALRRIVEHGEWWEPKVLEAFRRAVH
jgi:putative nucleotidyltransferase with HDIG domain